MKNDTALLLTLVGFACIIFGFILLVASLPEGSSMGTPLPPNEPGNLCVPCWGPSQAFGPGPTPTVIQLRLTNLLPGEFFTDGDDQNFLATHWLEQTGLPCTFNIIDGDFSWTVAWNPANTTASVTNFLTLRGVFFASIPTACLLDLENALTGPAGNVMFAGFATITWDLEGL